MKLVKPDVINEQLACIVKTLEAYSAGKDKEAAIGAAYKAIDRLNLGMGIKFQLYERDLNMLVKRMDNATIEDFLTRVPSTNKQTLIAHFNTTDFRQRLAEETEAIVNNPGNYL